MSIVKRIRILASDKKITIAELERKLNLANSSIRKWDERTPGIDKVQKVADYFHVPIDYLVGGKDRLFEMKMYEEIANTSDDPNPNYTSAEKDFQDVLAPKNTEFSTIQRYAKNLDQKEQAKLIRIMEATFEDLKNSDFEDDDDGYL
ncbi:helix-turn-helix transcriptional regulator [Listeria monocytogenes]|uniref:helix-turn-helix domain-containing protein n=1 Tax=Listeria monocytogenes TaxID=1639 RepID=UPI00098EB6B4|nr:helix-turn-helix transcriptional regulator [Listeria monocytogenes]EAD4381151.1 XRE family transcriptional regulator [Listeria monocytogenes]EAD4384215.1 XRE family transcriptional regulator [Listeria monocytogenes]EAD4387269.1 XRE family transcriptional regulator [Listeria monocytogenes]EAE4958898.1 XRE family transcriptional regulator [Listeria monocytogenes]EAE9969992.1 XRE family transcriptional regulator [Listeria monocytogenes]